jgi:hypothetical protein
MAPGLTNFYTLGPPGKIQYALLWRGAGRRTVGSHHRRDACPARYLFRRCGGELMNSTKRTFARDTPYDERAIALATRLGIISSPPTQPLSGTQWIRLWAMIGMELAKKEREFGRGRGRPPGGQATATFKPAAEGGEAAEMVSPEATLQAER